MFNKSKKQTKGKSLLAEPVPVKGPRPVTFEKWVEIVKSFQQITFDSKGNFNRKDLDAVMVSSDPWISWNMKRDKLME